VAAGSAARKSRQGHGGPGPGLRRGLDPRLEALIQEHGQARFLDLLDEDFRGVELGAMWGDAKFGPKHRKKFHKTALVGPARWMEVAMKLFTPLMPGKMKTFPREEPAAAWEWLKS